MNLKLAPMRLALPQQRSEDYIRWNPRLFKVLTLGHWPAAVDWLWIRVLQSQGQGQEASPAKAAYSDLDLATDLDPRFLDLYIYGANLLAVLRNDASDALDLLLKGERSLSLYQQQWPQAWALPLLRAYVYLFEMENMPLAAQAFQKAANLSGAPPYLHHLSKRLQAPQGQQEVALQLLNFLIPAAKEDSIRKALEKKRATLLKGGHVFGFE